MSQIHHMEDTTHLFGTIRSHYCLLLLNASANSVHLETKCLDCTEREKGKARFELHIVESYVVNTFSVRNLWQVEGKIAVSWYCQFLNEQGSGLRIQEFFKGVSTSRENDVLFHTILVKQGKGLSKIKNKFVS